MSVWALKMSPSVKPKLDSVFALNSPGTQSWTSGTTYRMQDLPKCLLAVLQNPSSSLTGMLFLGWMLIG